MGEKNNTVKVSYNWFKSTRLYSKSFECIKNLCVRNKQTKKIPCTFFENFLLVVMLV